MTSNETESIALTGNHRKAYESSLPEIMGLPKDAIQAVNTDVLMAVSRVRVACGQIQGLRGEVVAKLNDFDLKLWDKTRDLFIRAVVCEHCLGQCPQDHG